MGRTKVLALLAAIAALGLALRLLGLRLGLPYHHHWDEFWVVDSARSMLEKGNDVPTSYQYGAPLSRLAVLGFRLAARLSHAPIAPTDGVTLHWAGRIASVAICATATVPAFLAGRRLGPRGPWADASGLLAALFHAIGWQLVLHARYAVTDGCLAAFAVWSLGAAALYVDTRRLRWALASVAFAGLAFAFKVPGLTVSAIPIAALVLAPARPGSRRRRLAERILLVAAVPLVLACFLALNPHVIDHAAEAARDFTARIKQTRDGGFPSIYLREPGLAHLAAALRLLALDALHPVPAGALAIALAGAFGLARGSIVDRSLTACIAAVYAIVAILAIALPNRTFLARNYLVGMSVLAIGAGAGAADLGRRLHAWAEASRPRRAAAIALALGAIGLLLAAPVRFAVAGHALADDARVRALRFVEQRAARPESAVVVALTSSVAGRGALGWNPQIPAAIARPGLRFAPDANTCAAAASAGAAYIVVASYRNDRKIDPYEEQWPFTACPGYRAVADFAPSPYEHTFSVSPTWDGRASARVLERDAPTARDRPTR